MATFRTCLIHLACQVEDDRIHHPAAPQPNSPAEQYIKGYLHHFMTPETKSNLDRWKARKIRQVKRWLKG